MWDPASLSPVLVPNRAGSLRVWDEPITDRKYVIGADVAEGKVRDRTITSRRKFSQSERPDFSAAIVIELESGIHVATWRGYLPPTHYAAVLVGLGLLYNTALVVPELNGPGLGVVERMTKDFLYPEVYVSRLFGVEDRVEGQIAYGWRTTQQTRAILMNRIEEQVRLGLDTRDEILVRELRTMQFDQMGVPRAMGNDKDDTVLALGMALQGRHDVLVGATSRDEAPRQPNGPDHWVWALRRRQLERSQFNADRVRTSPFVPGAGLRMRRQHGLGGPGLPQPWK